MPGQRQDSTWVSRLQCVQAAVEAQIQNLAVTEPETKVAVVTFNSEVTIIGDGIQEPAHIAGDKLVRSDITFCALCMLMQRRTRTTFCSRQARLSPPRAPSRSRRTCSSAASTS